MAFQLRPGGTTPFDGGAFLLKSARPWLSAALFLIPLAAYSAPPPACGSPEVQRYIRDLYAKGVMNLIANNLAMGARERSPAHNEGLKRATDGYARSIKLSMSRFTTNGYDKAANSIECAADFEITTVPDSPRRFRLGYEVQMTEDGKEFIVAIEQAAALGRIGTTDFLLYLEKNRAEFLPNK